VVSFRFLVSLDLLWNANNLTRTEFDHAFRGYPTCIVVFGYPRNAVVEV
jgi:hypothetical protein